MGEVDMGELVEVVDFKLHGEVGQVGEIVEVSTGAAGLIALWKIKDQSRTVNSALVKEK